MYEFRDRFHEEWIDQAFKLFNLTDLKRPSKAKLLAALGGRSHVETAWLGEDLVAIGSSISDNEMYTTLFDLVVHPLHRGKGLGRQVLQRLIAPVSHTSIHLTSTFGNEGFYEKMGFKKHKTAYALYPANASESEYLVNPAH